jgi:hypothetical protein
LDSDGHQLLDIIVELAPDTQNARTAPQLEESFERTAEPVATAISELGGELVGKAWLNRTLRARVPAQHLRDLMQLDEVTSLDVPHRVTPD